MDKDKARLEIKKLEKERHSCKQEIRSLACMPVTDHKKVYALKKRNLELKDKINALSRMLGPDIIA